MKRKLLCNLRLMLLMSICASVNVISKAQIVTNVVGTGYPGFSGDGSAAIAATISYAYDIKVDKHNNIFVADFGNYRVRKVDASGTIQTIAGNGSFGYTGDGGPATAAKLHSPLSCSVNDNGNLYIVDMDNHCIRMVDTFGIITTVAGNGTGGFSGDGAAATNAQLHFPYAVEVDKLGNLYISDGDNVRIRKVDTAGIITTIAGTGTLGYSGDGGAATAAQLKSPGNICLDRIGNIYFVDRGNYRIRKISTSGIISTVAGNGAPGYAGVGGPATAANLNPPSGLTIDSAGNLYVSCSESQIYKIDLYENINIIAGLDTAGYNGDGMPAMLAKFNDPRGLSVDSRGDLFVTDVNNSRIRKINIGTTSILKLPTLTSPQCLIFPNPNNGSFTAGFYDANQCQADFIITNILGEKVLEKTIYANRKADINLQVPDGIYNCTVKTKNGTVTERIIVSNNASCH